MGVPGGNKGGAGHPPPNRQEGAGEQQKTRPSDEDESISLQPVVEDVEPSSACWRASDCYGHIVKLQMFEYEYLRRDLL